ncbi:MAG: class I SAM-dependent methyltransferase [Gammaproteobacteria bacterium]
MNYGKQFNEFSEQYLKHRPLFPKSLFSWISDCTTEKNLAWDVGTGNGQAAIMLTDHFDQIVATDLNLNQIQFAQYHPKIIYHCEPAERTHLASNSVNLITSACAAHWFDLKSFYTEAKRVLKKQGIISIWTYSWPETSYEPLARILFFIKDQILSSYWTDQTLLHLNLYRDLYFPFHPLTHPSFKMEKYWSIDDLVNFLSTWVTIQTYTKNHDKDFLSKQRDKLIELWPKEEKICFHFPIGLKIGKNHT